MRPVADEELFLIAAGVDNPNYELFETPLPGYIQDGISFQLSPEGTRRNIRRVSFNSWHVVASINGTVYVVGRTSSPEKAMRFADMAAMWFWPYRQRRCCPPGKSDLNFTVEQATLDCKNEASARSLLIQIEDLLASRLLLDKQVGENVRRNYQPGTVEKVERKSVRARLAALEAQAHAPVEFGPYIERIVQLEAEHHQLIEAFSLLHARIGTGICKPENVC